MADTRVQLEVEDWVWQAWMPQHFGISFYRERLKIRSGGVFDFDAVSADRTIVATISTSGEDVGRQICRRKDSEDPLRHPLPDDGGCKAESRGSDGARHVRAVPQGGERGAGSSRDRIRLRAIVRGHQRKAHGSPPDLLNRITGQQQVTFVLDFTPFQCCFRCRLSTL